MRLVEERKRPETSTVGGWGKCLRERLSLASFYFQMRPIKRNIVCSRRGQTSRGRSWMLLSDYSISSSRLLLNQRRLEGSKDKDNAAITQRFSEKAAQIVITSQLSSTWDLKTCDVAAPAVVCCVVCWRRFIWIQISLAWLGRYAYRRSIPAKPSTAFEPWNKKNKRCKIFTLPMYQHIKPCNLYVYSKFPERCWIF